MIYLDINKVGQIIKLLNYLFGKHPKYVLSDFIDRLTQELKKQDVGQVASSKISLRDEDLNKSIRLLKELFGGEPSDRLSDFIKILEYEFECQRMRTREETDEMVKWCLANVH